MPTAKPIPFHIELLRLNYDGNFVEHSLKFGVFGVEAPAAFIIASDLFSQPRIIQHSSHGNLDLPDDLIDPLAIRCFRLMASALSDDRGGVSGWWTISDITKFIRNGFGDADADRITAELDRHVTDGPPIRSISMVVDDDEALDAVPLPLPI